ncbi:MAG: hypothetical protein ACWGSQ_18685 [Longimicrobiales bacterium]
MTSGGTGGFLRLGGLSPRDRRAVLLGLVAIVPAMAYVLGVRPYRQALAEVHDRAAAEQELLDREMALLGSATSLPEAIRRAEEAAVQAERRMLQAPSTVLAEGELTDFLERSAVRNRVLLEEIRGGELPRGEEPPPGLGIIRLHLRGESDLQGVLSFLNEIETSQLLLRVRGLALEPEVARPEASGEGESPREAVPTGVVTFQLILDGFARPEEAPEGQAPNRSGPVD